MLSHMNIKMHSKLWLFKDYCCLILLNVVLLFFIFLLLFSCMQNWLKTISVTKLCEPWRHAQTWKDTALVILTQILTRNIAFGKKNRLRLPNGSVGKFPDFKTISSRVKMSSFLSKNNYFSLSAKKTNWSWHFRTLKLTAFSFESK